MTSDALKKLPLSDAQAYLAAIVESSDDAIISKDLNGNITSWNPSAERIFGYTQEEAIGKHISIIIPADYLKEEDFIIGKVRSGERLEHFETIRRRKDGQLINISVTVSPIKNPDGKIIGASKVARDISEKIRSEKALQDATMKKEEFLANMSHELRTPMNAVIGLANLIGNMEDLPPKARTFVQTLKVSADNMLDLINDLLDFAKIENGSFELDIDEFSLADLVERLISVANVKASEKGLKLYIKHDDTIHYTFMGDALRIHQVLMNLVSNAIKFTEKGAVEIEISSQLSVEGCATVQINVKDSGIGIAQDKMGAIFDKFVQADASITRRFGGSGLGLAISKAYIEKMNGTISVSSKVGIGSVFSLSIPLKVCTTDAPAKIFSVNANPHIPVREQDILVVEDYDPNIFVISSMLDMWGYNYDVARNGIEAVQKFSQGQYDVILMDMQMHDMDGLEATRLIRQMEKDKKLDETPIVAMTAHVRDQDRDKCFAAGMNDFIPKPFEPSILLQKISSYVGDKEQKTGS